MTKRLRCNKNEKIQAIDVVGFWVQTPLNEFVPVIKA